MVTIKARYLHTVYVVWVASNPTAPTFEEFEKQLNTTGSFIVSPEMTISLAKDREISHDEIIQIDVLNKHAQNDTVAAMRVILDGKYYTAVGFNDAEGAFTPLALLLTQDVVNRIVPANEVTNKAGGS